MRAASTMSLRWITFEALLTALQVITTFGLQSTILWARESAENPANTTWRIKSYQRFFMHKIEKNVIKLEKGKGKVWIGSNDVVIQYRVNSTNASTCEHCNWKFHEHWQINHDSITLFDTNIFQVVCKLQKKWYIIYIKTYSAIKQIRD